VETGIVVRVRLTPALERIRMAGVANAALGVPAHVTLLYPFLPTDRLDADVRSAVHEIARGQPPFACRFESVLRWPDTVSLAAEPAAPFERLAAALEARFPECPPYGGAIAGLRFVPHATIAQGMDEAALAAVAEKARALLPIVRQARAVTLIAQEDNGRWRTRWLIRLGG
jgi:2'-5' RNA ligase